MKRARVRDVRRKRHGRLMDAESHLESVAEIFAGLNTNESRRRWRRDLKSAALDYADAVNLMARPVRR